MKKLLFTLIIALLATVNAWAQASFTLDGLKYQETGVGTGQVKITGYTIEPKGVFDIPETVSPSPGEKYTVTQIADEVFSECTDLTEVILPAQINEVGDHAFHYCQKITSITCYNKTPPAMGESAFANTNESIPVYVPHNAMSSYKSDSYWSQFTNIRFISFYSDNLHYKVLSTFPSQVEIIGYTTMPAGVLEIPELVIHKGKDYAVLNIAEEVFAECSGLTELIFPTSLKLIGAHAFHYCQNLLSITCYRTTPPAVGESAFAAADESIPVYVPDEALASYKSNADWSRFTNKQAITYTVNGVKYLLTSVYRFSFEVIGCTDEVPSVLAIPSTISYRNRSHKVLGIKKSAFNSNEKITEVRIPESVTNIGEKAFQDCRALTKVDIGSGVTTIEDYAFCFCTALAEMTVRATVPPAITDESVFYSVNNNIPVYVPAESLADYRAADFWKEFTNLQAIGSTGLQTPSMPESISIQGGMLHNPQQLPVIIYDLTGRLVYSGNATTVELPAGMYIVSCNGASCKAVF